MRICFAVATLMVGGMERQLTILGAELVRRGHEVHVASGRNGVLGEQLAHAGVIVHEIQTGPRRDGLGARIENYSPMLFVSSVRLLRRIRPDVVQTWSQQMHVVFGLPALLLGVPFVFSEGTSEAGYCSYWRTRLMSAIALHSAMIVSNSAGGDRFWQQHGRVKDRALISNALRWSRAEIDAPADGTTRARLGLGPNCRLIACVGRLIASKRVSLLIEAMPLVRSRYDVELVVCGSGNQSGLLHKRATELGVAEHVHFLGLVDDVAPVLKEADLFVSLSSYEGSPNTVLEAMAFGCPVVVSDIEAHRELLDESCASFARCTDAGEVAEAICGVLERPEEARAKACISRAMALEQSVEKMTDRYLEIYERLANGTGGHKRSGSTNRAGFGKASH